MSLDDRIRRGLHHSVDQLMPHDGSIEVALAHVKSVTVRRQRIRMIAFATALVALVVALAASQSIGRLLLTVDPDLPPVEERDRGDDRRTVDESESLDEDRSTELDGTGQSRDTSSDSMTIGEGFSSLITPNDGRPQPGPAGGKDDGERRRPPLRQEESYEYHELATDATGCWATAQTCKYAADFIAPSRYRSVSIFIRDERGRDVTATIYLDRDGDGRADTDGMKICTVASPFRIPSGATVRVVIGGAGCEGPAYARGPTSGSIVAEFQ